MTSFAKLAPALGAAFRSRRAGAGRGARGTVEPPLRSELLSIDQLRQHALELAGRHEISSRPGPDRLLPRLAENEQVLLSAYRGVTEAVQLRRTLEPAGEWLLDNFYLVEEQIRTARRHLPRVYSKQLPRLITGPAAGYPRVYDIALELISHVDGKIDEDNLRSFVSAYQTIVPLKLGELWAIPIMLRLALIENLRRVAARLASDRLDRDLADHWADRMLETADSEPQKLILVTADMARSEPPMTSAFVAELERRLHGRGAALTYPLTWIEQGLAADSSSIEQLLHWEYQQQAADQVSIGNSIGSLRFLESLDWREFVESVSFVEQTLRTDPAGVYAQTDFATRDACRHVVERTAKHSSLSERDIARTAVELALARASSVGPHDRTAHVGYFVLDDGLATLEQRVKLRRPVLDSLQHFGLRHAAALYLGSILLLTLLAVAGAAERLIASATSWPLMVAALVLATVGLSQLAVSLVNLAVPLVVKPRSLPRMDFSQGLPADARTLVAVPTLLTGPEAIEALQESLEIRYLANRDTHLHFALLTDYRDAPSETMPDDDVLLGLARRAVESLREKYKEDRGNIFFLFHRPRQWNEQERVWMGRERKRGKLGDLNALLRGNDPAEAFSLVVGDVADLQQVRYVITLDTDTQLPRDAAQKLVATLDHPLNRPVYDPQSGLVRQGYGVLQPRVATSLVSSTRSWLVRIFGGEPGVDPYTRVVSDVYQDVFHEGSFIGKGIYDVDAFERTLAGRFPDNLILSHDLVEGCYVRSALVSDVMLYEDYPSRYLADVSRHHRWIRGDWQIARWILPRVPAPADLSAARDPVARGRIRSVPNPLSLVSRWKIFDNLRRSLVPGALVALALLAWIALGDFGFWTLAVISPIAIPHLLSMLLDLRKPEDVPLRMHVGAALRKVAGQTAQLLLTLAFLPHTAVVNLDAVIRTLIRLTITRRYLLQWRTASEAEGQGRSDLLGSLRADWFSPAIAAAAGGCLAAQGREAVLVAGPLVVLWFFAPAIAWLVSIPLRHREVRLSATETIFLHTLARRTWRFFETFIGPEDNWLPPDNYQEHPVAVIAHRTSPTNIGLSLLANLAAYDFGYITAGKLIARTAATFRTLEKLERYQGHLLNWYDTRTLAPLGQRYISTVDSGNFIGHLITLQAGLAEILDDPIASPQRIAGLADTIEVLLEVARPQRQAKAQPSEGAGQLEQLQRLAAELRHAPPALPAIGNLLQRLSVVAKPLAERYATQPHDERAAWATALESAAREQLEELHQLAPWILLSGDNGGALSPGNGDGELGRLVSRLAHAPSLREVARLHVELLPEIDRLLTAADGGSSSTDQNSWLTRLREACRDASSLAAKRIELVEDLIEQCGEFNEIDYAFLYDRARNLLAIGYNLDQRSRDGSYYDLLASEARLCSFVGIAQDRLPQDHWFALGRLLTTTGGRQVLLSWSGSMFEYLMPMLVMPSYPGTLLDETCQAAIARQIQYGRQRAVPWGMSESGYNVTDANLNYQYRAFGVPGLGFKRGLAEDLVVAPYATLLALLVAPREACANLRRLVADGFLGPYGFFEAIDYTPARVPVGQDCAIVRSFMAHHQGMSLLGLASRLLNRPMQRRFEANPIIRASELLLQEKIPQAAPFYPHSAEVLSSGQTSAGHEALMRVFQTPHTQAPEVHLLSNGRYHVMVTAAGGGYSRWKETALTRWEEDATRDHRGLFCYLRDTISGDVWSNTYQPTLHKADIYEAIYTPARAEFHRRDFGIDLHTDIAVSPEDDVEVRRLTITNRSRSPRTLELTSYAEIVLTTLAADQAHPAFSNLFVETEIFPSRQAILATRRARSSSDQMPWMVHLLATHATTTGPTSYETDRSKFLGRCSGTRTPAAIGPSQPLSDSQGSVLDPIAAIRSTIVIEPDQSAVVDFVTGIAATRDAALALAQRYSDRNLADRVYDLAWTHSQVMLQHLGVTEADAQLFGRLASAIVYPQTAWRAAASILAKNRRGQSGLWGYGISGDLPIVLLRIGEVARIDLVRQLVRAHGYWRSKGLAVDLVIWNEDHSGYRQALQDEIMGVITGQAESQTIERPGGIFVRRAEQVPEEDRVLFESVARIIISDSGGSLAEQTDHRGRIETPAATLTPVRQSRYPQAAATAALAGQLRQFNGLGGFAADGQEYVITTSSASRTPAPWANVLANARFGTVVSESGSAYTWSENAHEFRLTPWYNDPVTDAGGEAFYLRDEETGRFWSPTPLPAGGTTRHVTRHGFGYTSYQASEQGLRSEMTVFVPLESPVKFVSIQLRNESGQARRLSLFGYVEWVLGESRSRSAMHTTTEIDAKSGALLARNRYNADFGDRVAFFDVSEVSRTVTGNRTEFIGRNGTLAAPAALARVRLSGKVGPALDPCGAMQVQVILGAGETREVVFILGAGQNIDEARALIQRFRGVASARTSLDAVKAFWQRTLGALTIRTPDENLNLLSSWLVYQVLACRLWARSGYYQSGGAFGFRDQLQDVMALVYAEPRLTREHLLRAAEHQFREGDVQHWWHPPKNRGVRTHFSDDYLWLPLAACRYVEATGDTGVFDERLHWLEGRECKPDEESYYDVPNRSEETGTLYDHCLRAIDHGLRFGQHGLPLMGCGDWNDGMNLVGIHGKGESVWLAFFLFDVLQKFAEVARARGDQATVDRFHSTAATLRANIEQNAWDGQWYRRAYFDDGTPLGSASNSECQIDSLPQSWAVLSGAGDHSRAITALDAVDRRLVRRDSGLIQLFDPPFDHFDHEPGYIKGYVPGVRENGGQYTHAAVWTIMAFAELADPRAWELFELINPLRHGAPAERMATYKVEPYVVAADVYAVRPHVGRGGWTWYTGSAGWLYRLIVESLLGLKLSGDRLCITPLWPGDWTEFSLDYRYHGTNYQITIRRADPPAAETVTLDGSRQADAWIPLVDDHQPHTVEVVTPGKQRPAPAAPQSAAVASAATNGSAARTAHEPASDG